MPLCPWADYLPIPSSITGVPIPMQSYLGVVEHVTEGNGSPYPWFCNPASQAFSHFWISKTGALEQYMDTSYQSWAQMAGNATYHSVETEGFPTEPLTQQQIETFGRLLAWAYNEHEMPVLAITDTPGDEGLIAHGDGGVAWGNHPLCPGDLRKAQRPQILAIAAALVMGVPKPPPEREDHMAPVITFDTHGNAHFIGVSPAGHPLHFEAAPGAEGQDVWSVVDVTDEIAKSYPGTNFTIQP